ncbi:hypothetical protein CAOG_05232 [Capsaspora owczarzaki ATCC 30864]|uniref:Uncharacterized protein n=1 Tax=Capsaspora owczarzaki (strain ATCC 30864) TaxID=595528 RepID=A0A0D2VTM7_CAPO3|nr:hypothetical protein CAOG_05232 [Capsaspora owczarzaki ATCC 30864]KJE94612.1 hypothetical protein CAOG_005232 [Capsaspora owczarzaki ATCC 30864]|eukprot:XP_004346917.1 hypothetical protein CAOG_05232 [Capsaspora owczarzaki ATCC 30864]
MSDLLSFALFVTANIIRMVEEYEMIEPEFEKLSARVRSLERPLEVLKTSCGNLQVYEDVLRRLNQVLDSVNRFFEAQAKQRAKGEKKDKILKFIRGESINVTVALFHENIDVCIVDLNAAVQAAEVLNAQQRVQDTAKTTVEMLELEKRRAALEEVHECVQCGQEFKESSNAMGTCKFHPTHSTYSNRGVRMRCCDKEFRDTTAANAEGCRRGRHIKDHHVFFPYLNYFSWLYKQKSLESEIWLSGQQVDLEDGMTKWATVGVRTDGHLFVRIGKGNFNLMMMTIDPNAAASFKLKNNATETLICTRGTYDFPGELDQSTEKLYWYVRADWILHQESIAGVRLQIKSCTSDGPLVKELFFKSLSPLEKGETKAFLPAGSGANIDTSIVKPPPKVANFTPFPDSITKAPPIFEDENTTNSGSTKLRLKNVGPAQANPNTSGFSFDTFVNEIMVMNLAKGEAAVGSSSSERIMILAMVQTHQINVEEACRLLTAVDTSKTAPDDPVTIIDCYCDFLVDGEWVRSRKTTCQVTGKGELPFTVEPKGVVKVTISGQMEAPGKSSSWHGRAYVARLAPVTMRITLETMEGAKASKNVVFHNPATSFNQRESTDMFFLHCDDPFRWERGYVSVSPADQDRKDALFKVKVNGSTTYNVTLENLQSWAYTALKETPHATECELSDLCSGPVKTRGFIDHATKTIVGFHFEVEWTADKQSPGYKASDSYIIPSHVLRDALASVPTDHVE